MLEIVAVKGLGAPIPASAPGRGVDLLGNGHSCLGEEVKGSKPLLSRWEQDFTAFGCAAGHSSLILLY